MSNAIREGSAKYTFNKVINEAGDMSNWVEIVKLIPVPIAALIVGNMFLKEVRRAREIGKAWYAPYFTLPGGIVMAALMLPVIIWLFSRYN